MTVSSLVRKVGPFAGDGVTTVFPFDFKVFKDSDLYLATVDTSGTVIVLAPVTNYAVALNPDQNAAPGGNITLVVPLPSGTSLFVTSNITPLQLTDLTNQGGFYPAVITAAYDKLTILIQQIYETLDRTLTLDLTDTTDTVALTAALKVLNNASFPAEVSARIAGDTNLQNQVNRALLVPEASVSTLPATAARANKYMMFDSLGNPFMSTGTGTDTGLRTDLIGSSGASLVSFLQTGTGAVLRSALDKFQERKSVLDFFTLAQRVDVLMGNAALDVTTPIATAWAAHRNLDFPAGTYLISAMFIPANSNMFTAGLATKFKQLSGTAVGTRLISVQGSNVGVGSLSVEGNIATDTNEQNHGVFIQSNSTLGSLENIFIGDIFGKNIRGDVVYFGQQAAAYTLKNVHMGHITFDNVYRNGVSCVSAQGFSIKSIVGKNIGLFDFDIESNAGSGVCINGYLGYCKGRTVGFIGTTGTDYIDACTADMLDLDGTRSGSTPAYPPQGNADDAVVVRNNKYIRINKLIVRSTNRFAVTQVTGDPTLVGSISIGNADLATCSLTDTTYNGYISAANVSVGHLEANLTGGTAKYCFVNFPNVLVSSARISLPAGCSVFRSADYCTLSNCAMLTNNGIIFNSSANGTLKNSSFTCERLTSFSDKCSFDNVNVTASFALFTSGDRHGVLNSTLNGVYYALGTTAVTNTYLAPLILGAGQIWVDTTGRARIKSTAPTSDTDGSILAVQGLQGTATYDPPSLGAGAVTSTTVTVTGVAMGDTVKASFSLSLGGLRMWEEVTATNTATVWFHNPTGGTIDIASGTLKVKQI